MARLRYNLMESALAADITSGATSITLTAAFQEGGVNIPTVSAPNTLTVRIGTEILTVTAYTSGATSATVVRGQEDTIAAEHFAGDPVKNVITKEDVKGGGGGYAVLVAASNSSAEDQSKADFICSGTNDEVVFQSIIDTYGTGTAGTAQLYIHCAGGEYSVDAQIDIDCNADVHIIGNPNRAPLFYGHPAYFAKNTTGDFSVFNCAGTGQVRSFVGIMIDEFTAEAISSPVIEVAASRRLSLKHVTAYAFTGGTQSVIGVLGSSTVLIEDSDIEGDGSAPTVSLGSAVVDLTVHGSYIYADTDYAIEGLTLSGSSDILITDSVIDGGVRIDGNVASTPLPTVRIRDSHINGFGGSNEALYLTDSLPQISGGTYESAAGATAHCIRLENCDQGVLDAVTVIYASGHAIWILDSDDVKGQGCILSGYGRGTDATYSGIILDGDTNRCSITNNQIRHGYGSGNRPLYGIRVDDSTCDDNYINNNSLRGASKTVGNEISDAGTTTSGYEVIMVSLGDEGTTITNTGNPKITMRMPYAFCLTKVRASLTTQSSSGDPTFDINEGGSTILSTKLSIDSGERTSTTATTPAVISDSALADDAEMTFDIDTAGTGATGPKISLLGWRI